MRLLVASLMIMTALYALPAGAFSLSGKTINAGTLPSSPLYFADKAVEKIALTFTFGAQKKAGLAAKFAAERIAEAESEATKKTVDVSAVEKALGGFQTMVEVINKNVQKIPPEKKFETQQIDELFSSATGSIEEIIEPVLLKKESVSEIKKVISKVKDTSEKTPPETATAPSDEGCDLAELKSCVLSRNCTENTSEKCFLSCPDVEVECDSPSTGKICTKPADDCSEQCTLNFSSCYDECLTESDCSESESKSVGTKSGIIRPIQVQKIIDFRGFKLRSGDALKFK